MQPIQLNPIILSINELPKNKVDQQFIETCIKKNDYSPLEIAMTQVDSPDSLQTQQGNSLFGYYVNEGNEKVIEIFLKNKANPNGCWMGTAFLSHAVSHCWQPITELFLHYGANMDCLDDLLPKVAIIYDEILEMAVNIANEEFMKKILSIPCTQQQLNDTLFLCMKAVVANIQHDTPNTTKSLKAYMQIATILTEHGAQISLNRVFDLLKKPIIEENKK